jgi:thioester reductase-like protein
MSTRVDALASEITLDADIVPATTWAPLTAPAAVLVTGGTGFLGAFVISDLLRLTQAHVYCLVRADDAGAATARLMDNLARYGLRHRDLDARVTAIAGDVAQARFGLDDPTYDWLAEHVDSIYHLAASVSFMPGYTQLKATNVDGLRHVLRLAAARRTKSVHYSSTYAVFNSDAYALAQTVYETPLVGTSDGFDRGYDRSKWVAEQIVRIARDRGIPVSIYRAGFISGDTYTGVHNKMDPVAQMFAVVLCTGKAFPIEALLHLTPVDFCSAALVRLSVTPGTINQIFHLVQERPLSCVQALRWLEGEGFDLTYVDFPEWYGHLKILSQTHPAFMPVFYLCSLRKEKAFGDGENISSLQFDTTNVRRYLDPAYHCPGLHDGLLRRYFDYIANPARGYQVLPKRLSAARV